MCLGYRASFVGLPLPGYGLVEGGSLWPSGLQFPFGSHEADLGLIAQPLEAFRGHVQKMLFQSGDLGLEGRKGYIQ